jgi:aspartyl protease family protein
MQRPDEPQNPTRGLGKAMTIATWILVLVLLTLLFNQYLDRQRNPNQSIQWMTGTDGLPEVVLQRNRYGHYVASGYINGQSVEFMVDTGASDVSIPGSVARALQLQPGPAVQYQTANGLVTAYRTSVDQIQLGGILIQNVAASINPHIENHEILLGMSFLKHLEFTQRGDTLTLRPMSN